MRRLWICLVVFLMLFFLAACSTSEIVCEMPPAVVMPNESAEPERITVGELEGILGYNIYYCGISDFYPELNGKRVELREVLKKDPAAMEAVLEQAKKDAEEGRCVSDVMYDGGTRVYIYGEYRIFKCNKMSLLAEPDGTVAESYNKDVLIGTADMDYDAYADRITELRTLNIGYSPREAVSYVYNASTEPIKPFLILRNDGGFQFVWSALSSYLALGDYTQNGKEVTLKTADGQYTFIFEEREGDLIFCEERSTTLPEYRYTYDSESRTPIPDGAVFTKQ